MSGVKEPSDDIEIKDSISSNDTSVVEIEAKGGGWIDSLSKVLIGMVLMFGGIAAASIVGWKIPGITTVKEVPVIKEVIREVPKEVEKPVDRPIDRPVRVPVPMQPYRISIDAPYNIPGCFPIVIHLFYGNGDSRSYGTTLCGRW